MAESFPESDSDSGAGLVGSPWPGLHACWELRRAAAAAERALGELSAPRGQPSTVIRNTGWSGAAATISSSVDFDVTPLKYWLTSQPHFSR